MVTEHKDENEDAPAVVKNGQVVSQVTSLWQLATCDRCGRTFPAKYIYCVCKG